MDTQLQQELFLLTLVCLVNIATAGYGAGTRIEQVVLLPILGINTAIITIISQNFGAKNYERVKETYIGAIKYSLIIMIGCSLLIFIFFKPYN